MARYIDADLLLTDEKTHTLPIGCGKASGNVVVFVDDIEKLTTADVVEVVRCKDCKYFSEFHHCGILGFCEPNEYCSRGERRK